MHLQNIFHQLSVGPLNELAIVGTGSGTIPAEHIPKLTFHVGQALVALYTRFPLRIRSLELETVDGLYEYPLQTRYAQTSSSTELYKFIKDSSFSPFTGDVLKVVGIQDSEGCALPLNKRGDELSWFLTSYDTLKMDYPVGGSRYRVEYRARHPALPVNPSTELQAETVILLPQELETALLHHVAGNVYGSMSMEGALAKSQGHLASYENECQTHETVNTWDQHHEPHNTKFEKGGWV